MDDKLKKLKIFDDELPVGNLCYTSNYNINRKVITLSFSIIPIEYLR
ncbi:MAG: hypothetical protein IJU54_02995 [Alphaproteobacteria bacterium]|nr:hypothetical protein [Alphaproteobacteria bacterium]